jgi:hypothetical protein
MSTLTQQEAMAADALFQARVTAAMVTGAAAVLAEDNDTEHPISFAMKTALATQVMQNPAPLMPRFALAVATNPGVSQAATSIMSISQVVSGLPTTIATYQDTGFAGGEIVEIAGAADQAVNGCWETTVVSATSFSIPILTTTMSGAGGTVSLQPTDDDITTAIASVWADLAGVTPANSGT